jgi:hypothetical protein
MNIAQSVCLFVALGIQHVMSKHIIVICELPTLQYFFFRYLLNQSFSTAGPRPGTGPWHQLYRAARGKYFIVEIF